MTRALRIAGLGVIFVLTLASSDPVDFALGVALGGALLLALGERLRLGPAGLLPPLAQRLLWFPVFAAAVVADVLQGAWDVALRVLTVRPLEQPGIVRVPIGERTERGVAVSALATTLSPGSVLVDVDWQRGDLVLHVIDASDPAVVRARLDRFYERFQRRVFP
jgi:multicomponent Na+:H+ antiporter subunit E